MEIDFLFISESHFSVAFLCTLRQGLRSAHNLQIALTFANLSQHCTPQDNTGSFEL